METLLQDVRHGLRILVSNPVFAIAAVLTLALGIGANVAVFTLLNAALLRPLPYPQPNQLVAIERQVQGETLPSVSATFFTFVRDHQTLMHAVAAYDVVGSGADLIENGEPTAVSILRVSSSFFSVFDIAPEAGSTFGSAEDAPEGEPVAMISDHLWRAHFQANRSVIGAQIRLRDKPYRVLGILPPSFRSPIEADIWLPLRAVANPKDHANLFKMVGRMRSGISLAQANQGLLPLEIQFKAQFPDLMSPHEKCVAVSYRESLVGSIKKPLIILSGLVLVVLLIACSNIANLLLAVYTKREAEMGVRFALGATPGRILRQLFTEICLLVLLGDCLSLAVVWVGMPALLRLNSTLLSFLPAVAVDVRVIAFLMVVSFITAFLCVVVPAFQLARVNVIRVMNEGTSKSSGGIRSRSSRGALAIAQISLSLILLICAGLLVQSYMNLERINPGFNPTNVLSFKVLLSDEQYTHTTSMASFDQVILNQLRTIPSVTSVATVSNLPIERGLGLPFDIIGRPDSDGDSTGATQWRLVSPEYFKTMEIPILSGRAFHPSESASSAPVIIINQQLAHQYFGTANPVGQHMIIGRVMGPAFKDVPREIIGVVGNVRELGLEQPPPAEMFVPLDQAPDPYTQLVGKILPLTVVVRTASDPSTLIHSINMSIRSAIGNHPATQYLTLDQLLAASVSRLKFNTLLLSVFAGIALTLSAVGMYGLISYSVAQRTKDMGIRLALGSSPSALFAMVLREAAGLTLLGLAIGVCGAIALTRILTSMLFGVTATSALVFVGISVFLSIVMVLASLIPAVRVTSINPIEALRRS
jgi:putative ABC transport system permease protein